MHTSTYLNSVILNCTDPEEYLIKKVELEWLIINSYKFYSPIPLILVDMILGWACCCKNTHTEIHNSPYP